MNDSRLYKVYNPARDVFDGGPARVGRDTFKKKGAEALAAEIDAWWHERGFTQVRHWTEDFGWGEARLWVVRGNLVRGMPPKRVEMEIAA